MQILNKNFYEYVIPKSLIQIKLKPMPFESKILTNQKACLQLMDMIKESKSLELLFRGSRDGFKSRTFC
jgi:hypothetical protein